MATMSPKKAQAFILSLAIVLLLAAAALVSLLAMAQFEKVLVPELDKKGLRVAESVRSLLVKSINYGVPLDKLRGSQDYFDQVLAEHQESRYLAVTTSTGQLLYRSSQLPDQVAARLASQQPSRHKQTAVIGPYYNLSLAVIVGDEQLATLHLGLDNTFVLRRIKEIGYDILTVLLIAFIFTFELMLLIFSAMIHAPMASIKERLDNLALGKTGQQLAIRANREFERVHQLLNRISAQQSSDSSPVEQRQPAVEVRGLVFLFIFAAMFPVSFLPIYLNQLYQPLASLSKELTLSLPFGAYYLVTALAIALAGPWSERVGRRRPMVLGALLGAAGYLGCGLAPSLVLLTACYCLAAIGFGLVMVASQGYIIDTTRADQRSSAIARFWAGFFSGTLCGTGIGAILAHRIGFQATFMVAAAFSLASSLLMVRLISDQQQRQHKPPVSLAQLGQLLANGRFFALVFGLSVPAKVVMTGFMFYLVPKFLDSLAVGQSSIGRILMIYSLMFVFVGPPLSRFFEKHLNPALMSLAATVQAGAALLLAGLWPEVAGVVVAISLYALFRASCTPATTALLLQVSKPQVEKLGAATVISVSTLCERLGNISGPILAGLLITAFGFEWAMASYGILTLAGALLVMLVFAFTSPAAREDRP